MGVWKGKEIDILGDSEIWLNMDGEALLSSQDEGECTSPSWGTDNGVCQNLFSVYFKVGRFILFNKVKHE